MLIRDLSISARARSILLSAGFETIEDLQFVSDEDLLKLRNMNQKCVTEIRTAINSYKRGEESKEQTLNKSSREDYNKTIREGCTSPGRSCRW